MSVPSSPTPQDPKDSISEKNAENQLHIVGIGASAGGLEALELFFSHMTASSNLAFVVIQHLSPDFKSLMDEILARQTTMAIHRVENGMEVQPNRIYLIPAKKEMTIKEGRLFLSDKDTSRPQEMLIDIFFRSLAQEAGPRSIGVVLSGTGSDGSRGLRAIHEAGGLVLVQSPDTAKFDGMPRSALDTGLADYILPPSEMPEAILQYVRNPSIPRLPSDSQPYGDRDDDEDKALTLLKRHYGIDFAYYKPTTVGRRLARRMAMRQIQRLPDYLDFLSTNSEELGELYKDLLIGVTSFFRDPEAFAQIEKVVVPSIFNVQHDQEEIRAWVVGCATGEEVYSLGILFLEEAQRRKYRGKITIFATDVHSESLEFASQGVYPADRLEKMPPERLNRFFKKEGPEHYKVCQDLRSMVVFASHNVISDPPFTKMDLVSCRNMLIYLLPVAQEKAVSLFHFALRVGGYLFMGSSESPGSLASEFEVADSKAKLFTKLRDVKLNLDLRLTSGDSRRRAQIPFLSSPGLDRNILRDYDLLLHKYLPSGLLVGEHREVLHYFGDVGRYLTKMAGRAERDVLEMVDGDLKLALGAALHRSASERSKVVFKHVKAPTTGGAEFVDLSVDCLGDHRAGPKHFHISFLPPSQQLPVEPEAAKDGSEDPFQATDEAWRRIVELDAELQTTRENLQATIEELQTTNEELQATNEEMLAANEELQSTNEELHSVNEELYTVNAEFEKKNKELRELNEDHDNLLRSMEVGTLFLDRNLRIRKYNPAIARSFKLLPQDVGRPVDHLAYQLEGQTEMLKVLRKVLETGRPSEREVRTEDGWLLRRILPFRNSEDQIDGVVLTFTDITTLKMMEAERHEARLLRELAATVPGMVFQFKAGPRGTGRYTFVSDGSRDIFGDDLAALTASTTLMTGDIHAEDAAEFQEALDKALRESSVLDHEHRVRLGNGTVKWLHTRCKPKKLAGGEILWSGVCLDITARKEAQGQVAKAAEFYLTILNNAPALIWRAGSDAHCDWFNKTWLKFTGRTLEQEVGDGWLSGVHHEDREYCRRTYLESFEKRAPFEMEYRLLRHDGVYRWILDFGCPFETMAGEFGGYIGYCYDITDRRETALALERARVRAEDASRTKSEFLANMSHEIRTPLNGVFGMLQLLGGTPLSSEQRDYVKTALDSGNVLLRLIDDILDISKIEAGKVEIVDEPFDLSELLDEVCGYFRPNAENKGLRMECHPEPSGETLLRGDVGRLRQIVGNLVGNAIKFTETGTISVRALVETVHGTQVDRLVTLSVSDTGIGIPGDKQEFVFSEFNQVDGSYRRHYSGAGLGLAIVRKLTHLMHGTVRLESTLGEGTTVSVTIPLRSAQAHVHQASQDQGAAAEIDLTGRRILLAEDDPVSQMFVRHVLERVGAAVSVAESGETALELLKNQEFDAALLDVQMPGMDGLEVLRQLRESKTYARNCAIPVIAQTAHAMQGDEARFLEAGMNGYITKPVSVAQLKTVIARCLSEAARRQSA